MSAMVPRKVIVASAVPSPAVKLRPVVPASVRLLLVTLSVTLAVRPSGVDVGDRDLVAVGRRKDLGGIFTR